MVRFGMVRRWGELTGLPLYGDPEGWMAVGARGRSAAERLALARRVIPPPGHGFAPIPASGGTEEPFQCGVLAHHAPSAPSLSGRR
jgi:hypothetical protein